MSKEPRNPQVIAGAMREQVEKILESHGSECRYGNFTDYRVRRISELLNELDEALTLTQLTQSLKLVDKNSHLGAGPRR